MFGDDRVGKVSIPYPLTSKIINRRHSQRFCKGMRVVSSWRNIDPLIDQNYTR
jgi:hypothetical protein